MAKHQIVSKAEASFEWIDVVAPQSQELSDLAVHYHLDELAIESCLQSRHLSKCELLGKTLFVIDRAYDAHAHKHGESVQDLTRKIAIFVGLDFVITIHRTEQEFFENFKTRIANHAVEHLTPQSLLVSILFEISSTFMHPISGLEDNILELEKKVLSQKFQNEDFGTLYLLRRHCYVIKGSLLRKKNLEKDLLEFCKTQTRELRRLKDQLERLLVYADEIYENSSFVMNLQVSLAAQRTNESGHRTNEVMKVLTTFSAFFLPLNLIAGVYGMNFEFMPELKWAYGYPAVLCVMASVSLGITFWFYKRGWMS